MLGRRALFLGTLAAVALATRSAAAGSYLSRTTVLLGGALRDAEALRKRMTDKELARVVHAVAKSRVDVASRMEVPPAVAKAHPHLLLVLESVERAADAAVNGSTKTCFERLEDARREEKILRGVMRELGFSLED